MNMKFNMTIELTEEDVKEAVAQYISQQLGDVALSVTSNDVNFQIGHQTDMRGEHYGYKVSSARVKVKKLGPYYER